MSNLAQFTQSPLLRPPTSIVNRDSAGGMARLPVVAFETNGNTQTTLRRTLSGALTANTLKTMLTLTGSGVLLFVATFDVNATSRSHRLKMTIDGVAAFDATSTAAAGANDGNEATGVLAIGTVNGAGPGNNLGNGYEAIPFFTGVTIEIASSLSETDNVGLAYAYRMTT